MAFHLTWSTCDWVSFPVTSHSQWVACRCLCTSSLRGQSSLGGANAAIARSSTHTATCSPEGRVSSGILVPGQSCHVLMQVRLTRHVLCHNRPKSLVYGLVEPVSCSKNTSVRQKKKKKKRTLSGAVASCFSDLAFVPGGCLTYRGVLSMHLSRRRVVGSWPREASSASPSSGLHG